MIIIKQKLKLLIIILLVGFGIYVSYIRLSNTNTKITDKEFVSLIEKDTFANNKTNLIGKTIISLINYTNPMKLLKSNKTTTTFKEDKTNNKSSPLIYLYNTHQGEEYAKSSFIDVSPTVSMNDYILQDIFNKNGYSTIVEDASIKDILRSNNWKYYNSYKASRILLEDSIIKYPTLKYFIDIHRDSLSYSRTTTTIDNKMFAKVLFIVGLENPTYQVNLSFTEKINDKLNKYYPTLSKGILKKSGVGVNGVYNQDFSPNTILIEIGGTDNTPSEVLNSTIAFSKCFMEVLHEESN